MSGASEKQRKETLRALLPILSDDERELIVAGVEPTACDGDSYRRASFSSSPLWRVNSPASRRSAEEKVSRSEDLRSLRANTC